MATLDFDGVDDYVQSSALGLNLTGALSILAVVELDAATGFRCIVSHNVAAGTPAIALEFEPTNNTLVYELPSGTPVSTTVFGTNLTDTLFVAVTKSAGATIPRFHFKNLTTLASTIHEPGSTSVGNPPTQAGGNVKIGNYGAALADDYNGPIAMVAEFDSELTDGQIDTILSARATSAIYQLAPKLLTELTQLTPVDLMGLTTFSAATGATLTGPNPTNWALDGSGAAPGFTSIDWSRFPNPKLARIN